MNNWSDYAHTNDGGGMILLLLVLGAIFAYLFFSKGFWLDKWCRRNKWDGSDIQGDIPFKINEAISQKNQEGIPYTPSLEIPFDDPEVPNRLSKRKKPKKKRVYKRRKKR